MSAGKEMVLKPCPFCGAKDEAVVETMTRDAFLVWWAVECQECSCEVGSNEGEAAARAKWNTRTPDNGASK